MTLRILFVERDLTTADLLIPGLERKGYQVWLASTQRQATSAIRTKGPNLLVLDMASFGSRGYDLCDLLQSLLRRVPTVLLVPAGHDPVRGTCEGGKRQAGGESHLQVQGAHRGLALP